MNLGVNQKDRGRITARDRFWLDIGCFALIAMICSSSHYGGMSCLGETVAPRSQTGVKRASGTA